MKNYCICTKTISFSNSIVEKGCILEIIDWHDSHFKVVTNSQYVVKTKGSGDIHNDTLGNNSNFTRLTKNELELAWILYG